jgi:hypothetical protein
MEHWLIHTHPGGAERHGVNGYKSPPLLAAGQQHAHPRGEPHLDEYDGRGRRLRMEMFSEREGGGGVAVADPPKTDEAPGGRPILKQFGFTSWEMGGGEHPLMFDGSVMILGPILPGWPYSEDNYETEVVDFRINTSRGVMTFRARHGQIANAVSLPVDEERSRAAVENAELLLQVIKDAEATPAVAESGVLFNGPTLKMLVGLLEAVHHRGIR